MEVARNGQAMLRATSSSTPRVPMMQAGNLRNRDDLAQRRCLHVTRRRRVAIQGQMRPGIVIILKIPGQDSVQMSFVEHNDVIEALPQLPNRQSYRDVSA